MSAGVAIGLTALLALAAPLRAGSRARAPVHVEIDPSRRTRLQVVPQESFSRVAVLSRQQAERTALSELRAMTRHDMPTHARAALRDALADHRSVLWVDLLKVNPLTRGRGLGAEAVGRLEDWGRSQGATLALAVSYDFSFSGSPLGFWERLGYLCLYEDDEVEGSPSIIFKEIDHEEAP
jgi:GNAT superfamily N-acetyltransferase